jgi:uncharacterized protein (DUF1778 family)
MYLQCAHNNNLCLVVYTEERRHGGYTNKRVAGAGRNYQPARQSEAKVLIDRAAEALGRSRSDFMLETACREAEAVLLDRRYFSLSADAFKRFTAMLDKPPASNLKLQRLLQTKAPWAR